MIANTPSVDCKAFSGFPKRILIDVTIAATTSIQTGIQRVVRNIVRQSEFISRELNIECIPVVIRGDRLTAVGFDGRKRMDERIFDGISDCVSGFHSNISKLLGLVSSKTGSGYLKLISRLRKLFVPKTPLRVIKETYFRWTHQQVEIRKGDLLLLLDASWNLPIEPLCERAKAADAQIGTVVYDLIPVNHPQFHDESLRRVFSDWLEKVVVASDFFIGISETVRNELMHYASPRLEENFSPSRFASFRLGADFDQSSESGDSRKSGNRIGRQQKLNVAANLSEGYYLSVGTIEPRKNHSYLLDAFEKIWEQRPEVKLCIAGKVGWMCDDLIERMRNHPRNGESLFFLSDVSDQMLKNLYQNAKALIFPSVVEGFGLPIIESLHHGTPVLASNTPIHREVGGDQCHFFDLSSTKNLSTLVERIESGEHSLDLNGSIELTDWNSSCRQLLTRSIELASMDSGGSQERSAA